MFKLFKFYISGLLKSKFKKFGITNNNLRISINQIIFGGYLYFLLSLPSKLTLISLLVGNAFLDRVC